MAFNPEHKIWMNGEFVAWNDAKIHVCSHVVHYGSSIFEGARCYETKKGSASFRHGDHVRRLFDSAKIYRMTIPFDKATIDKAILDTIRINGLKSCYIRPIVYRGYAQLGVDPTTCPVDVSIACWEWGKYLGPEALEKGVSVCVSSWNRMAPNTFPAMAKAGANYMNSQLIKMEAKIDGYDEGIALDNTGMVSEGSAMNIFVVRDGILYTPPLGASVLAGITRDSAIQLATKMGYQVVYLRIPREMLYIADEVFFTGSAAEITPVTQIDKITVGAGTRGPITAKLQEAFFDVVENGNDPFGWLTFVYDK